MVTVTACLLGQHLIRNLAINRKGPSTMTNIVSRAIQICASYVDNIVCGALASLNIVLYAKVALFQCVAAAHVPYNARAPLQM